MTNKPARESLVSSSEPYPLVLSLPNEIICEIFLHFLPIYPLCPPLTGTLSPTSLTHICRRWREIALDTPALWRAISFSYQPHIPLAQQFHIFDIWLSRSSYCPLSIEMDDGRNGLTGNISGFIVTAVLHCSRWEHLKLHIVGDLTSDFPAIEGPMPLLRSLDLNLRDRFATWTALVGFRELPLLRTVILDTSTSRALSLKLAWAQVTSLTLAGHLLRQCVPFLQQTPNVVHCELKLNSGSHSYYPLLPNITLPRLKFLTLEVRGHTVVTGFDNLVVPALRSLRVPERFLAPNPVDVLTSFILKSGCMLEDVRITGKRSVSGDSYRAAFPAIQFSFDRDDNDDENSEAEIDCL